MNSNNPEIVIRTFFESYFQHVFNDSSKDTYWKYIVYQKFIYDFTSNFEGIINVHHPFAFLSNLFSIEYEKAKQVCDNYFKEQMQYLVSYFLFHPSMFDVFQLLKIILEQGESIDISGCIMQICFKYTERLKPLVIINNDINKEHFFLLDNTICMYFLNKYITMIYEKYQEIAHDSEFCRTDLNKFNNNISYFTCDHNMFINADSGTCLQINVFQNIDVININNYFVWSCFKVPSNAFQILLKLFKTQYDFLVETVKIKISLQTFLQNNNQKSLTQTSLSQLVAKPIIDLTDNFEKPKYKKKTIPPKLRKLVWNAWIGAEIGQAKCLCCDDTLISQIDFSCGHIESEYNGGNTNVDNLRPICKSCNSSMGKMHMIDYMNKFGFSTYRLQGGKC